MFSSRNSNLLAMSALPALLALGACSGANGTINGQTGVPLAEVDTSGAAPFELINAGPDKVIVTEGTGFSIDVEGDDDAVAGVRFVLDDDFLGITREDTSWGYSDSAIIRVTMPPLKEVDVSGSGSVEIDALAKNAEVALSGSGRFISENIDVQTLAISASGSGSARLGNITAETIEIDLSGSGGVSGKGSAGRLEASLSGSGGVDFAELKAEDVRVSASGSGSASLQSDGTVVADLSGSGGVRVKGSAKCTENASGSGSLICSG